MGGRYREDDDQRRGGSTTWSRDEQGRKYRDRDGDRYYQNQDDRDSALEERYKLCRCCSSLLMRVVYHGEELVADYLRWVSRKDEKRAVDGDLLHEWEVERFGDRAYATAHAQMLFLVRRRVFQDRRDYSRPVFQADEQERYERSVKSCPVAEYGHLKLDEYLAEVVTLAEGIRPQTMLKQIPKEGS